MSGSTPDSETTSERIDRMTREFRELEKTLKGTKHPSLHDTIGQAVQLLGGSSRLAAWAGALEKNEDKFWTGLFPKLPSPQDGSGPADDGLTGIGAAIEAARQRANAADENEVPGDAGTAPENGGA